MSKTTAAATTETSAAGTKRPAKGSAEKPAVLFGRPHALTDAVTNYCPGCSHGIVQRLVAETIDELDIEGTTIGVCPVGCSVTAYDFYACDMAQAAHGRAPAVATGLKRALPGSVVFTYQGDGDLASIGMAETIHAATRGENITVIFINNAIYGMTGGQMAPTSLPQQVTQTSPYGRDVKEAGHPIRVCELLSSLDGVALAQRVTVNSPKNVRAAKRAIKKAFQYQVEGLGFSIIEVLATCPTNWGMTPQDAFTWLQENMVPYYPLGVYRDAKAEAEKAGEAVAAKTAAATKTATDGIEVAV
jgi:2-oxoglutarate ferredoxin oxidoreductase subunit beta